jgi:hypothetical protein
MWRHGARRADGSLDLQYDNTLQSATLGSAFAIPSPLCATGSLDRVGFLGGASDMMARSLERQPAWLAEARAKPCEAGGRVS